MRQNILTASKRFLENVEITKGNAEKHNLYNGLANLAGAVAALQGEVEKLKQEIGQVRQLKRAYPNYYLDTRAFVGLVKRAIA
jgi:hypothetical protein